MGCITSKEEICDNNPNLFRVAYINEDGRTLWYGDLAINNAELSLLRPDMVPLRWPLQSLRRYGYESQTFNFESGRRCETGHGIFSFHCLRAQQLFQTVELFVQNPAGRYSETISNDGVAGAHTTLISDSSQQIFNLNLSPSGTIQSNSGRSYSTDTLNGESIYLEPTPGRQLVSSRFRLSSLGSGAGTGPLSPDQSIPRSPGSPNSVAHIEMTSLNPVPEIVSISSNNVYQDFTLHKPPETNNNNSLFEQQKKLSLDIPPQEFAPSPSFHAISPNAVIVRVPNCYPQNNTANRPQHTGPQSPSYSNETAVDFGHPYMNVALGELQGTLPRKREHHNHLVQTPTSAGFPRPNFNVSSELNRVYENMDTADVRPMLSRTSRLSKPDLFAKCDETTTNPDKSEPSTPTMHYIILDLDHTSHNQSTPVLPTTPKLIVPTSATNTISLTSITTNKHHDSTPTCVTSSSTAPMLTLPPESPKKGVLDYAKIDFNKTVALSNSANPSSALDSGESRKTRHSSVAKVPVLASAGE